MKIVVLDGGTLNPGDLSWQQMKKRFGEITIYDQSPPEKIIERSKKADILVVNKVIIDKSVLDQLPRLKFIAVSATGYNNVDIENCNKRGILVSNVTNYGSDTVAQHVFALLLALTNQAFNHNLQVKDGEWEKRNVFSFWSAPINELSQKTIGIVGYGNIGRKVAKIAEGFNMNILFHSSSNISNDSKFVDLETLLAKSDVISINTHLNEHNQKLINRNFLSQMKSSAFLINTSRGGLIDESELYKALKNKKIAGAALDVLNEEPAKRNHPLLSLNNCIVTPHNAWASIEARSRLMDMLAKNIHSFINGTPKNLVS